MIPFTDLGKWKSRFGEENDEFYLRHVRFDVYSSGEPSGQKIRLGVISRWMIEDISGE